MGDFEEGEFCYLNCFSKEDEYIIGSGVHNYDSIDVLSPVVEVGPKTKVNIYPNPFDQYLQIDLPAAQGQDLRVLVYNSVGQLMLVKVISQAGQNKIDTQNLPHGFYLIPIYKDDLLIGTEKITKTN